MMLPFSSFQLNKMLKSGHALGPHAMLIGLVSQCFRKELAFPYARIVRTLRREVKTTSSVPEVKHGVIPALVKHFQAPPLEEGDQRVKHLDHQVEEGSAAVLTVLAQKPEYQQLIVDSGAVTHLVNLLKRHRAGPSSRSLNDVTERAAEAIRQLAWESSSVQIHIRMEGGIPPLVELLDVDVINVQRAAARALRVLAAKNNENKDQIVERGALPTLVFMLKSKNCEINHEALSTLVTLLESSKKLMKHVMDAGALHPTVRLLGCTLIQRRAALLLAELDVAYSDRKYMEIRRL